MDVHAETLQDVRQVASKCGADIWSRSGFRIKYKLHGATIRHVLLHAVGSDLDRFEGVYPAASYLQTVYAAETFRVPRAWDIVRRSGYSSIFTILSNLCISKALPGTSTSYRTRVWARTQLQTVQDAARHLHDNTGLAWLPRSYLSIVVDDYGQPIIGGFDDLVDVRTISWRGYAEWMTRTIAEVCSQPCAPYVN